MLSTQPKSIADKPWLDPDAKPQILIEGINKTFGGFTAVDSVNLRIYKGEMFALVGASGCGKTTLLRMLAGFATPSAGRIMIDDMDMTAVPPHERPVNMMFQSYALFPHMNVEQNVGYGLRRMALDGATRAKRIRDALEMVQLGPLAKTYGGFAGSGHLVVLTEACKTRRTAPVGNRRAGFHPAPLSRIIFIRPKSCRCWCWPRWRCHSAPRWQHRRLKYCRNWPRWRR